MWQNYCYLFCFFFKEIVVAISRAQILNEKFMDLKKISCFSFYLFITCNAFRFSQQYISLNLLYLFSLLMTDYTVIHRLNGNLVWLTSVFQTCESSLVVFVTTDLIKIKLVRLAFFVYNSLLRPMIFIFKPA